MNKNKLKHAILFCRISDEKQEDGYSLDAQEKYGIEYCNKFNWEIQKTLKFVETASKSDKRNKFQDLIKITNQLSLAFKSPIALVVEKLDRLTRNYTSLEQIWKLIEANKLVIHFYKDNKIIDSNCSPAELFNLDIQTAVAKYQALNTARETRKGMREKASQGWYPGRVPLGYKNCRTGLDDRNGRKQSTVIVDPDSSKVKLAQRIFELRATQKISYREIASQIIKEGLVSPIHIKTFKKSSVEKILKNKFYSGLYEWQGELFEGKHQIIIPKAHLEAVHGEMNGKATRKHKGLFSNFLTCYEQKCGCSIVYDPKNKIIKSTGEVKKYHYYRCSDGRQVHFLNGGKQTNVTEEHLLSEMRKPVREISITDSMAKRVSQLLRVTHDRAVAAQKNVMDGFKQAIQATEEKEDEIYADMKRGLLNEDSYQRLIAKVRSEKRQYEQKLELHQVSITGKFYETSERIIELANNAEILWNSRTREEQVSFLKLILSNQQLDGLNVRYQLKKPFEIIREMKETEKWCPVRESNPHASRR